MKRLLTVIVLSLACVLVFAQGRIPQLDRAAGKRVTFTYDYSVSRGGGAFEDVTAGSVTAEDNAYRLEGLGLQIVCDGVTRWTLDEEAGELVIENVDKDDILANPALLISSYRNYGASLQVNGGSADTLDVVYHVDEDVSARFFMKDIRYSEPQGKSDFTFDVKSLPSNYIVTDLR